MSASSNVRHTAIVLSAMSGLRLPAAESLLLLLPSLTEGTLESACIAYRSRLSYLALEVTSEELVRSARIRQRVAFWVAREGGWARALEAMAPDEVERFQRTFSSCELALHDITPAHWAESVRRVFSAAGCSAPPESAAIPELRLHVGGEGWQGITFDPATRLLHVPSVLAPPAGDVLHVALTPAGAPGESCMARATVVGIIRPAEASPSMPAGFTLALDAGSPDAETILSVRCSRAWEGSDSRAAPRYPVVGGARIADPGEDLRHSSSAELQRDYMTNLSHGGALVRTSRLRTVGERVDLHLRLPPGRELVIPATVAHRGAQGLGLKFDPADEVEAALAPALASLTGRPRRVLVVDDDAFARKVLEDAFHERGFECVTATNGDAGLHAIIDELFALDAVVTDVVMPGLSGEALVSRVREAGGEKSLVVIAVTADPGPELARRLEASGADGIVGKEAGPAAVVAAVEAALERRREWDRSEALAKGPRSNVA
ncbi:MAG TPA: response regulator [Anaeromyxobacter sp.]